MDEIKDKIVPVLEMLKNVLANGKLSFEAGFCLGKCECKINGGKGECLGKNASDADRSVVGTVGANPTQSCSGGVGAEVTIKSDLITLSAVAYIMTGGEDIGDKVAGVFDKLGDGLGVAKAEMTLTVTTSEVSIELKGSPNVPDSDNPPVRSL